MLSREAITKYLDRKLQNFTWLKRVPKDELWEFVEDTNPGDIFKLPMFKHQMVCWIIGVKLRSFLFFVDMGGGKAQSLRSKILTPDGWATMGELHIGSVLSHPDGGISEVTALHPQGWKELFKVTFSDGSSTECCADHLWRVYSPEMTNSGHPGKVLALKDLGDLTDADGNRRWFIPIAEPQEFVENIPFFPNCSGGPDFQVDPYTLGALLGDGCGPNTWPIVSGKRQGMENPLKEALLALDVVGPGRTNRLKAIPECYQQSSIETRVALLQGLLDSDGTAYEGGKIAFHSSSPQLIADTTFIVRSLGGVARLSEKTYTNGPTYKLDIRLPLDIPTSRLKRELALGSWSKPLRSIVSVESSGFQEAKCITIDRKDGLYVTDDFIVTHNSKIVLDIFTYRKNKGECKKALILVPNVNNVEGWREQVGIHSNHKYVSLHGTKAQRQKALKEDGDVYVCNYQGLQTLCAKRVKRKLKGREKMVTIVDKAKMADLLELFDFVVLDESHKLKNRESLTFKLTEHLTRETPFVYGLTGTPLRDPQDLWSQFYIIDDGETLGANFCFFREVFYRKVYNPFGADWDFDKTMSRTLSRMIRNRSIRYADHEMNDLPPKKMVPKHYLLAKEQREQYDNALQGVIEADGHYQELENAYHKMRQICSGYLEIKDEETGEKFHVDFPNNPKLELLQGCLEDMPETSKMVVFYDYTHSGDLICEMLKKNKIGHRRLYSGTKDPRESVHAFKHDEHCYVLVVNWRSGGTGLNLQHANYCWYHESPTSIIERKQTEKRCHRTGQTKRTYIYDPQARHTVEYRIQESLAEGHDLFNRVVEGKAKGLLY